MSQLIVTRPGFYLADHPPARSQTGHRRNGHKPTLILTHTAESGTDLTGADLSAEGTARFIARRTTPGSYHRVGDRDSIIPMASTKWATWGSRFVNDWAVHISLAMNAADWDSLTTEQRDAYVRTWVEMAVQEADVMAAINGYAPRPVLLTGHEARQPGASGFSTHGRVDPDRRHDPGGGFPWERALTLYAIRIGYGSAAVEIHSDPKDNHGGPTVPTRPDRTDNIKQWQRALAEAGLARAWWDNQGGLGYPLIDDDDQAEVDRYADGDFGDTSLADSLNLLELVDGEAALSDIGERAIDLFGKIDDWRKA